MAYSAAPTDEQVEEFRAAIDRLANERDGLLFRQHHQPPDDHGDENADAYALDAAVADLATKKRIAYPRLSKEEATMASMIELLHGLLQLEIFSSLHDVQDALSAAFSMISQNSEVVLPLFDHSQLQTRPLHFKSTEDLLLLPIQFYERRPRPPAAPRKKRRIMFGYPIPDESTIAWKMYMGLLVAESIYKQYDSFGECRDAILRLVRAFEPLAGNFEPVLSLFWIDIFLRQEEIPEWLDWETIIATIQHYEFDTTIELCSKMSFISPEVFRSYLAELFIDSQFYEGEEHVMEICQLLVSPNSAGRILRELKANPVKSDDPDELIIQTHLPEKLHHVLQPYHPVMFHIKRLLFQDCLDQAVSLSRQLGEIAVVPDEVHELLFRLLFTYLVGKGKIFYKADEPVLGSLFYNFNLFAGDRGFLVFSSLYRSLYDSVEEAHCKDIRAYVQANCRQTLLHLTAAKYPPEMALKIYSRYMPVPLHVLKESTDQQKAWMTNYLAIESPSLPDRIMAADSSAPDFRRLLYIMNGEDEAIIEQEAEAPVPILDYVPETRVVTAQDDRLLDESVNNAEETLSGKSLDHATQRLPEPVVDRHDQMDVEQEENDEIEVDDSETESENLAQNEEQSESESVIELSADSTSDEHEQDSGLEEEQPTGILETGTRHDVLQRARPDDVESGSDEYEDASASVEEEHVTPADDLLQQQLGHTHDEDDDYYSASSGSRGADDDHSEEFFEPENAYAAAADQDGGSYSGDAEVKTHVYRPEEGKTDRSASMESQETASLQVHPPQPLVVAGDEEYFAEESQVSEGEEEIPRKQPKHHRSAEATMAGYDADATDNEEQGRDDEGRRHRHAGHVSFSIQHDGYDGGVSQGHTEEEEEDAIETEHPTESEPGENARNCDHYQLSDAMSAADEFTSEAEDSELDDRDIHVDVSTEILSVPPQPSSTLHEHAVAAQGHFSTRGQQAAEESASTLPLADVFGADANGMVDNHEQYSSQSTASRTRGTDDSIATRQTSQADAVDEAHEENSGKQEVASGASSEHVFDSPQSSRLSGDINFNSPFAPSSLTGTPSTRQGDTPSSTMRHSGEHGIAVLPPIFEEFAVETFVEVAFQESHPSTPVRAQRIDASRTTQESLAMTDGQQLQEVSLRRSERKKIVKSPFVGDEDSNSTSRTNTQSKQHASEVAGDSEAGDGLGVSETPSLTGNRQRRGAEASSGDKGPEAIRQTGQRQGKASVASSSDSKSDEETDSSTKKQAKLTTKKPENAKKTTPTTGKGEGSVASTNESEREEVPAGARILVKSTPQASKRQTRTSSVPVPDASDTRETIDASSHSVNATPKRRPSGASIASMTESDVLSTPARNTRSAARMRGDESSKKTTAGKPPVPPRTARKAAANQRDIPETPSVGSRSKRRLSNASETSGIGRLSIASGSSSVRRSSRIAAKHKDEVNDSVSKSQSKGSKGKGSAKRK